MYIEFYNKYYKTQIFTVDIYIEKNIVIYIL